MAAGAAAQRGTWRVILGDTEQWAPPQVESSGAAGQSNAAAWRVIFGSTQDWAAPKMEALDASESGAQLERCEFCRELIAEGEPFVTNSAGERFVHRDRRGLDPESPCQALRQPVANRSHPGRERRLRHFARGDLHALPPLADDIRTIYDQAFLERSLPDPAEVDGPEEQRAFEAAANAELVA